MDTFTTEDRRRAFPDYGQYITDETFDLAIRIVEADPAIFPHPAYARLLRFLKRTKAPIDVRRDAVMPGFRERFSYIPIGAPILFFYNTYNLISIYYHWSADPAEHYVERARGETFAVWDGKIWYEPSSLEELHRLLLRFEEIYTSEYAHDDD